MTSVDFDQSAMENLERRLASMPPVSNECVHLWQLDCETITGGDERCLDALSPSERERATRFLIDCERRVFVVGHAMLRSLLGAYLDRSPGSVTLTRGELGKLELEPDENCGRLEFNVSHSGDRILYAFTRGRRVGIDLERVRPVASLAALARAILTRDEWSSWCEMDESRRRDALFTAWVRKEAVLKGIGCGLRVRPSRIAVSPQRGEPLSVMLPAECAGQRNWQLRDVHPEGGWIAALALEGSSPAMLTHGSPILLSGAQARDQPLHAGHRLEVVRHHLVIGNAECSLLLDEGDDLHQPHRIDQPAVDQPRVCIDRDSAPFTYDLVLNERDQRTADCHLSST